MSSPFSIGQLSVWSHYPKSVRPKARVIIVHGLSEHSGRHLNTVDALLEAGYAVVRFDLRGAGQSGGRRQWVTKFGDYVDDLTAVYNYVCRELEPQPLFLLGHSLGGAIATHFIVPYQKGFAGLVLSAPAYIPGGAISAFTIAVGRKLVKFLPTLRIPGTSDKGAISRDPSVVKAFLEDPLSCHSNTLNQGNEILEALPQVPKIARQIQIPTLIAHGSHDSIIRLEGSFEILENLPAHDRTLYIRPGGYHESHNDTDKLEYFNTLIQWLNRQLAKNG